MKVAFDGGIKLEFYGAKVTSDGCLLAGRDLMDSYLSNEVFLCFSSILLAKFKDLHAENICKKNLEEVISFINGIIVNFDYS